MRLAVDLDVDRPVQLAYLSRPRYVTATYIHNGGHAKIEAAPYLLKFFTNVF